MEEYGLITFKSVNFSLQAEEELKKDKIVFKTIPTPREVSNSCGLSLLIFLDDVEKVKNYIAEGRIKYDKLFRYAKENHTIKVEEII